MKVRMSSEYPITKTTVSEVGPSTPLQPASRGHGPSPPDSDIFSKATAHRRDAEAAGDNPYAEYKKKVAATESSSSGIERVYRWAEKKLHHGHDESRK